MIALIMHYYLFVFNLRPRKHLNSELNPLRFSFTTLFSLSTLFYARLTSVHTILDDANIWAFCTAFYPSHYTLLWDINSGRIERRPHVSDLLLSEQLTFLSPGQPLLLPSLVWHGQFSVKLVGKVPPYKATLGMERRKSMVQLGATCPWGRHLGPLITSVDRLDPCADTNDTSVAIWPTPWSCIRQAPRIRIIIMKSKVARLGAPGELHVAGARDDWSFFAVINACFLRSPFSKHVLHVVPFLGCTREALASYSRNDDEPIHNRFQRTKWSSWSFASFNPSQQVSGIPLAGKGCWTFGILCYEWLITVRVKNHDLLELEPSYLLMKSYVQRNLHED